MTADTITRKTNRCQDLETNIEFPHNFYRLGRQRSAAGTQDYFSLSIYIIKKKFFLSIGKGCPGQSLPPKEKDLDFIVGSSYNGPLSI
jgi:hypothetical protein